eukprot:COSAG04_NODE_21377_length_374_cov_1.490909_1_plen_29_part_10
MKRENFCSVHHVGVGRESRLLHLQQWLRT